ncbi:MAG TPA: DUF2911 domain-containing protein [Flavisolibacter sp.]|jgi:hypothetical protein|nr:DUF2911 domain-containing protein [Flavisolibacter sp.]
MNKKHIGVSLSFLLAFFLMSFTACAQGNRASPAATATGKVGDADITINYSSPSVKGRTIWGELVPYGKVWRAGANAATTFETSKDITVEGKKLPAGKYSLFAVPGENEWKILFNSQTGQWGTQHDEAKDVLAVTVKPTAAASMSEQLVYDVNGNGFVLKWEKLQVPVSIK